MSVPEDGTACFVVQNCCGFAQSVAEGVCLAEEEIADMEMVPETAELNPGPGTCDVNRTTSSNNKTRRTKMLNLLELPYLPQTDN